MGCWHDILPRTVADRQIAWERARNVRRMRECGMTFVEIGDRAGIGRERARQIYVKGSRGRPAPVEMYLAADVDVEKLAHKMRRAGWRAWYRQIAGKGN